VPDDDVPRGRLTLDAEKFVESRKKQHRDFYAELVRMQVRSFYPFALHKSLASAQHFGPCPCACLVLLPPCTRSFPPPSSLPSLLHLPPPPLRPSRPLLSNHPTQAPTQFFDKRFDALAAGVRIDDVFTRAVEEKEAKRSALTQSIVGGSPPRARKRTVAKPAALGSTGHARSVSYGGEAKALAPHMRSVSSSRLPPAVLRPPPPTLSARPATVVGVGAEPVAPPRRKRRPVKIASLDGGFSSGVSPAHSDVGESEPSSPSLQTSHDVGAADTAGAGAAGAGAAGAAVEVVEPKAAANAAQVAAAAPAGSTGDELPVFEASATGLSDATRDGPTHVRSSSSGAPAPKRPPPPAALKSPPDAAAAQAAPVRRSGSGRPLDL
jgi:hypothetical protein